MRRTIPAVPGAVVTFAGDDMAQQLEQFARDVAVSDYWKNAVKEYGIGAATVTPPVRLAESAPSNIDDTQIQTWLANKLNTNDPSLPIAGLNSVYILNYPANVTITLPTANATVPSPVHIVASASSAVAPITAMRLYIDSVDKYDVFTNTLDTSLVVTTGTHNLHINAWDGAGNVYQKEISFTVGTQAADLPPVVSLNVSPALPLRYSMSRDAVRARRERIPESLQVDRAFFEGKLRG